MKFGQSGLPLQLERLILENENENETMTVKSIIKDLDTANKLIDHVEKQLNKHHNISNTNKHNDNNILRQKKPKKITIESNDYSEINDHKLKKMLIKLKLLNEKLKNEIKTKQKIDDLKTLIFTSMLITIFLVCLSFGGFFGGILTVSILTLFTSDKTLDEIKKHLEKPNTKLEIKNLKNKIRNYLNKQTDKNLAEIFESIPNVIDIKGFFNKYLNDDLI